MDGAAGLAPTIAAMMSTPTVTLRLCRAVWSQSWRLETLDDSSAISKGVGFDTESLKHRRKEVG